jgi:hypothetical protein
MLNVNLQPCQARRPGIHRSICIVFALLLAVGPSAHAKKPDHEWSVGKILDENRARYFAGTLNNSSAQTTENGTWNGSANSTSLGDSTNTQINGDYSGTRSTSTSGTSVPIYRVYDNLVIEGNDTVYVTSERIRWRWSKGAHVAVNETVKYYVEGRKLHVLDNDGKEHTAEITQEIRKAPQAASPAASTQPENQPSVTALTALAPVAQASVTVDSVPSGADIEIDGAFVGNTPSTVSVAPGSHQIVVKKKGFTDWTKTLNVTGGTVHLNADLEQTPAQQ